MNYLIKYVDDLLFQDVQVGKSTVLRKIFEQAVSKGFSVDVFHCPMNPSKIEHIIIKELDIGFITSVKPHLISNIKEEDELIDMNFVLDLSKLKDAQEIINYNNLIAQDLFNQTIKTLADVKKARTKLEDIYASNMNFGVTDKVCEQILAKILKYI